MRRDGFFFIPARDERINRGSSECQVLHNVNHSVEGECALKLEEEEEPRERVSEG